MFPPVIEDFGSAAEQLILPLLNLVRLNVELLRKLNRRPLARSHCERDFRLKGVAVVPAGRFVIVAPISSISPCSSAEKH